MPLDKIGITFDTLGDNMTAPEFGINETIESFVNQIPTRANEITLGHIGGVILMTLFGYLYWKLSDTQPTGDFQFSKLRAISISSGIATVIGIIMLSLGYFTRIYPMVLFFTIFILTLIWIVKEER